MILVSILACLPAEEVCDPKGIFPGQAAATVDGAEWTAEGATWVLSGSSLQLNTAASGGWLLSLVAQATADGTTAEDAIAAAVFPVEFRLRTGEEGGWVLFYPDDGASFATEDTDGGSLTVSGFDDDYLLGCFAFEAANEDGDGVKVEAGTIYAVPLDLG